MEMFLAHLGDAVPPDTYFCYSPDYCVPDHLPTFLGLVDVLAQRFRQPVEWLSPGLRIGQLEPEGDDTRLPNRWLARVIFWLRRRGIY
jgi:hypothetical protein